MLQILASQTILDRITPPVPLVAGRMQALVEDPV